MVHHLGRNFMIDTEPLETFQAPRDSLVAQEGQGQIQINPFAERFDSTQTRTTCVENTRDIADPTSKEESFNFHYADHLYNP